MESDDDDNVKDNDNDYESTLLIAVENLIWKEAFCRLH